MDHTFRLVFYCDGSALPCDSYAKAYDKHLEYGEDKTAIQKRVRTVVGNMWTTIDKT